MDRTPGSLIDALALIRKKMSKAKEVIKELSAERTTLQLELIETLDKLGINQIRGSAQTATITEMVVPTVKDWDAFYKFIIDNEALYMLERRPLATAFREMLEMREGEEIPGVEAFTKRTISLRTSR